MLTLLELKKMVGEPEEHELIPTAKLETRAYDGYGTFAGEDVYELAVEWNRPCLSEHPEHFLQESQKAISGFFWYTVYADLSVPLDKVIDKLREKDKNLPDCYELRDIGIDLACGDADNQSLPFPIKICRFKKNADYKKLRPSLRDPWQGL